MAITTACWSKPGSGAATLGVPDSPGVLKALPPIPSLFLLTTGLPLEAAFAAKGSDIAAVIKWNQPGNMGLVLPQDGYLEFIRSITKKYGTLLICGEVMPGFRSSENLLRASTALILISPVWAKLSAAGCR